MNLQVNQIKSWVDKGKVFQNSLMQKWLDDNDILMYLTQNECKSIVAERFIRNMTANDSKSYLGYLNMSVDEYSNIYHRSIQKKSTDANHPDLSE